MNKKNIIKLIILLSICTSLTAESNVNFSGEIETRWGAGLPWTDSNSSAGRFLLGDTSLTGKLDAYYNNSSALAEGSVSYDAVKGNLNFSLKEIWFDYTLDSWGIRVGRQKTAWGKADGIDITNVICPSDMSSFSAMTSDDNKLAIDALRFSLTGNQFTADAFWIPFFTPAPITLNAKKPEAALWNGEYALKVSGYFSALDVSFYSFYGWDDTPFLNSTFSNSASTSSSPALPSGKNVSGEYKRMTMIGFDTALPIKETVLRAETAFFPMRHFQKSAGNTEQHNELSSLVGLDWMPAEWTFTAQYYFDYLFGSINALERADSYQHGITLNISKTLLNETLKLSLSGLLGFNDFDSMIHPSVSYSLSDQITLTAGAYIFLPGPECNGKYGKYKDQSCIIIGGKFSF